MNCPKCGGKQYCPCDACRERHKQEVVWIWQGSNGPIACGWCGYAESIDEWDNIALQQSKNHLTNKQ